VKDTLGILQAYFSDKSGIDLVILFGSRARRTASPASDIDIGVLYRDEPDILEIGATIEELGVLFGKKVDLVGLRGLEVSDPRLAYEIASEGIVVSAADEASFPAFKTRAFLAYFDIQPFLEKARAELDSRIDADNFGRPIHA
jgi:predicted nucleotidyltransferase